MLEATFWVVQFANGHYLYRGKYDYREWESDNQVSIDEAHHFTREDEACKYLSYGNGGQVLTVNATYKLSITTLPEMP
jgi:hypothetical protein